LPGHVLAPGDVLQVGDQRVEVRVAADAHTESDLLLWLPARRVLWAGGLVSDARVPELAQGSVGGWLEALDSIARLQPAPEVVIGTGISQAFGGHPAEAVVATRSYLEQLRAQLRTALDAGLHGTEPEVTAAMNPGRWVGFKAQHAFNVQRAWREVEAQWMSGSGASKPGSTAPTPR
jgi:glyoxylase-like metal-dependent hydrolase (beta-lactamase superfamily II)